MPVSFIVFDVSDVQVASDHYETHIESQPQYEAIVEQDNIYEEPPQVHHPEAHWSFIIGLCRTSSSKSTWRLSE